MIVKRIGMEKELLQIEADAILVCGYGRNGKNIEAYLKYFNKNVLVTDNDYEKIAGKNNAVNRLGINNIEGNFVVIISIANKSARKEWNDYLITTGIRNIYYYEPYQPEDYKKIYETRGYYDSSNNVYNKILDVDSIMAERIKKGEPFLASRWGSVEGDAIFNYTVGLNLPIDELQNNAGVFPVSDTNILEEYLQISKISAKEVDYLFFGAWCRHLEELRNLYSPNGLLCHFHLWPNNGNKWLQALEGKKVLIVHPFVELLEMQYKNKRELLYEDKCLPLFEFIGYKAVNSMGGESEYENWIQAYEKMMYDISKIHFDVALVGCGAYGMPIAAYIKSKLNKPAIHIGGTLQLFFGVKGKRWDDVAPYNEYWVRPGEEFKPKNYLNVENACYW